MARMTGDLAAADAAIGIVAAPAPAAAPRLQVPAQAASRAIAIAGAHAASRGPSAAAIALDRLERLLGRDLPGGIGGGGTAELALLADGAAGPEIAAAARELQAAVIQS